MTAVDTSSNVYYLITCETTNTFPKVFVARNIVQGIATLLDPSIRDEITGSSPLMACYAVPYSNGMGPM